MADKNYSFHLFEYDPAVSEYGIIETHGPTSSSLSVTDFRTGEFFRTKAKSTAPYSLTLDTEDKLLTIILDESGSATWNDHNGDRYTFLSRMLGVLDASYPNTITANLIGFGGVPIDSNLLVLPSTDVSGQETTVNFTQLLSTTFEDSVFDLANFIIVRNTDHFPINPSDGVLVFKGIASAIKDNGLTEGTTYYYAVWAENKNGITDVGKFLTGVPRNRILPDGLPYVNVIPRILPGISRDTNTQIIYSFQEKTGLTCYDSSSREQHGTIDSDFIDNFWLGDATDDTILSDGSIKNTVGVRFNGDNDNIYTDVGTTLNIKTQELTVNLWVYRNSNSAVSWLLGTIGTTNLGWALGLNTSGNVVIGLPGSFAITSSLNVLTTTNVPVHEWTMITVIFSFSAQNILVYKNGVLTNTLSSNDFNDTATTLQIGSSGSLLWNGVPYFGSLNQISISNVARDADFIADLFLQESLIFEATLIDSLKSKPDNGQRECLLQWQTSDNANYNEVTIVRKYNDIPAHPADGDVVLTSVVYSSQDYSLLDSYDFVANGYYYYRFFTKNTIGNYCDRNDALVSSCIVPAYVQTPLASPPLPVANLTTTTGNKKILLEWNNPTTATGWRGTKVYYGTEGYPTVSTASQGTAEISNGVLLTDTLDNTFAHRTTGVNNIGSVRFLVNGQKHFYTLLTYDVFGQFSEPVYISAIPLEDSTEVFEPDSVKDLHADLLDSTSLSLQWTSPTYESSQIDLWMDEVAVVFCNMTDTEGGTLDSVDDMKLDMCVGVDFRAAPDTEPLGNVSLGDSAFNLNGVESDFGTDLSECQDTFKPEMQLNYAPVQSGLIKGFLQPVFNTTTLAQRSKYTVDLWAEYRISNDSGENLFLYQTRPVRVLFEHPVSMALINKNSSKVIVSCELQGKEKGNPACPCESNPCEDIEMDGAYVGSRIPYVLRVELQWKGGAFPDGQNVNVSTYKANTQRTQPTDFVVLPQTVYTLTSLEEEQFDDGQSTGVTINKSYVDISILAPSQPENVEVVVSVNYNGFYVEGSTEINFLGVLRILLNLVQPAPDGIDFAEQTAQVFFIDPDFPSDVSKRLPAPDNTVVKWELTPKRYGTQRPFYSTDPRASSLALSGVFSLTDSGIARHVFFGPVSHIKNHELPFHECDGEPDPCCIGEEYSMTVSTVDGTMQASDTVVFEFVCSETDPQPPEQRFLMNAAPNQAGSEPHWITWADGSHLLKFQIARNPATSTIVGADCFRQCVLDLGAAQLLTLPDNQIVSVTGPGEILWNVVFKEDPYDPDTIQRFEDIDTYDSISDEIAENLQVQKIANIPLTGDTTDFYLRLNSFIDQNNPKEDRCEKSTNSSTGDLSDLDALLPCEWSGLCKETSVCKSNGRKWLNVSPVKGSTTLFFQNKQMTLTGGGEYDQGIPPLYVGFTEPLDFRVLDLRSGTERITEPVYDYVTRLTYVCEVRFANKPVPDGTPISVSIDTTGDAVVTFSDCIDIDDCYPTYSGKIYTTQVNDPLVNPTGDLLSLAYFTLDPLPNVTFGSTITLTCNYDKLGTATRSITRKINLGNVVSTDIITTETPLPSPPTQPPPPTTITSEMIVYDPTTNVFTTETGCHIARIGAFVGRSYAPDKFYIFGGFTGTSLSVESKNGMITRTSEYYLLDEDPYDPYVDPYASRVWTYTTDMHTPRMFGMSVSDEWGTYCIGGLEYNNLTNTFDVSSAVERYDFVTETWSVLTSMPEDYETAFGIAEIHGYYIYVLGGVNSVTSDIYPNVMNDMILRYSIIDDEWETILPSDENLCKRISPFSFKKGSTWYVYGGSFPKSTSEIEAERTDKINSQINIYLSKLSGSSYFRGLTLSEQQSFISELKQKIMDETPTPAYSYPATGFTIELGSETFAGTQFAMNTNAIFFGVPTLIYGGQSGQLTITVDLQTEWINLPEPRDKGGCIYFDDTNIAYFLGGSNQNSATTLRLIDAVDLTTNIYERVSNLERGKCNFMCTGFGGNIYMVGGLTSGHQTGFVRLNLQQISPYVEALGKEKGAALLTLTNDSGQLIADPVRVKISGRIRIAAIDALLSQFLSQSKTENTSAQLLQQRLELFPILYSDTDITVENGIATVFLEPRSEDPLEDFEKLATYIKNLIANTPVNPNEKFEGDLTREQLAALGEILSTLQTKAIEIRSGNKRDLYDIETSATIVDNFYFGSTVSGIDANILAGTQGDTGYSTDLQGTTSSSTDTNPYSSSDSSLSGQSLSSMSLVPLSAQQLSQHATLLTTFFNRTDWVPQVKKRLTSNNSTLQDVIDELNALQYTVPFGSSQLYDALSEAARVMSDQEFVNIGKYIYVVSDDSENLSLTTQTTAIEDINSIDQTEEVPVIYTVFSTSYPVTLSSMSERSEIGDAARISQATGGQSLVLTSDTFMNQIVNAAISASGGFGYGLYRRRLDLGEATTITGFHVDFDLPTNTSGSFQYRYSTDGYNFTDYSNKYIGSQVIDVSDFYARYFDIQVMLSTGFVEDVEDPYIVVGPPYLLNLTLDLSNTREDYIYLNTETVISNAEQVAMAVEGTIPTSSTLKMGATTSNSSIWSDYETGAKRAVNEFGKMFMLNRSRATGSIVPFEYMTTDDNQLFFAPYGPWDPTAGITIYSVTDKGVVTEVNGYRAYPREGKVYFSTRQNPTYRFKINVVNADQLRVGIQIANKDYRETVALEGVGFIYNTNDIKPPVLFKAPPSALKVKVLPESPVASDTFTAQYTYFDIDGQVESGTVINWYRNNVQLYELANKTTWTTSDLLLSNQLQPNDLIYFSVKPSDGTFFGVVITSPAVTVLPTPPTATNLKIIATRNGVNSTTVFDTSSLLTCSYTFGAEGVGLDKNEDGTIVKWYVNGSLFKQGTYSTLTTPPAINPLTITVGEIGNGLVAQVINNQVEVEVTPKTRLSIGTTVKSPQIVISNSVPIAQNVKLRPSPATTSTDLELSYTLDDRDITNGYQTDQSTITWFKSTGGNFNEVLELRCSVTTSTCTTVPKSYLKSGDRWYARLTPYDGLSNGASVNSNTILIL